LFAFRIWSNFPHKEPRARQVEFSNNLFLETGAGDMAYLLNRQDGEQQSPGKGSALLALWRFHHNWRDLSGSAPTFQIPLAREDRKFKSLDLLSRDPDHADFMRPPRQSPLAAAGAGSPDWSLPRDGGAPPPARVTPPDWQKTWEIRFGGKAVGQKRPARK